MSNPISVRKIGGAWMPWVVSIPASRGSSVRFPTTFLTWDDAQKFADRMARSAACRKGDS